MESEKVKCANCGYLAGKIGKDPVLHVVSPRWRELGTPDGPDGLEHGPHCFRGIPEPNKEYHTLKNEGTEKKVAFLLVINLERTCPKYFGFDPGRTPKEHADMEREEALRKEQQRQREADLAFQEERRKADRAETEARRHADEERRNEERAEAEARRKEDHAEAERIRREDREWKAEQDYKQWKRGMSTAIAVALIAALLAVLTEPWKQKGPPTAPQISPVSKP